MRKKFERATLELLVLCVPALAMAQTGQALIGNPLLSPDKVKEVKRQIVEAAHRELVPPPAPVPAPLPQPQMNPVAMMGSMSPGPSSGEPARQALSRLQVMAIVGDTALLATHAPAGGGAPSMPMPQMSPMQMPHMQGYQPGMGGQQLAQTPQATQHVRRTSSVFIRHREINFVEGFEVIPMINGDSVRLVLKAMPNEIVFSGSIQPAVYSPSDAVAANDLQKPSAEYVNVAKPDSTSMTGGTGYPAAAPLPAQMPNPYGGQFPVQQR